MNPHQRKDEITRLLVEAFEPETLGVDDESHLHEGHEGAKDGRSHFRVLIISLAFEDKSLLERHRMVYRALAGGPRSAGGGNVGWDTVVDNDNQGVAPDWDPTPGTADLFGVTSAVGPIEITEAFSLGIPNGVIVFGTVAQRPFVVWWKQANW